MRQSGRDKWRSLARDQYSRVALTCVIVLLLLLVLLRHGLGAFARRLAHGLLDEARSDALRAVENVSKESARTSAELITWVCRIAFMSVSVSRMCVWI